MYPFSSSMTRCLDLPMGHLSTLLILSRESKARALGPLKVNSGDAAEIRRDVRAGLPRHRFFLPPVAFPDMEAT